MSLIMLLLITYTFPISADSSPDTLLNSSLRVVITPITSGVRAGSLLELYDFESGIDLADGRQFGGIQCGPYIPMNGEIVCYGDTMAVFTCPGLIDYSTSDEIPIAVTITWTLVGRGLEIGVLLEATGDAELWIPLEIDFIAAEYQTALFRNQTVQEDYCIDIHGSDYLFRISGDQVVTLSSPDSHPTANWIFPNPSKGILVLNTTPPSGSDSYLTMRFFDVEPPRENCMGPDLHSIVPAGDCSNYYMRLSLGEDVTPVYFSAHPDGYERTATWIMDEIPFVHPDQGDLWGYSTTSAGDEMVTAQMIQLLEEHPDLKMNWLILPDGILTPNRDSAWCEPGWEKSWSHWHCTWRISTLAPPDYLEWLLNIQNDVYPWADRVNLGCHGYHHTPNPDSSFGEYHEFITYEPDEHMERFMMTMSDFNDMGLDTTMIRSIRYAGHRTSLSGLYATIAHGFEYYCNGVRWWEWMGGEQFWDLYISKYQTPEGRIWGTNTVWWGDYVSQQPYEYLSAVLERGKHCLLGAHPINMLAPEAWPEPYNRIDSLCTSLETDYPHFGWLFPIEYGEFLEDCYNITVKSIRWIENGLAMDFSGSTPSGQTIVAELPPEVIIEEVLIDEAPASWETRSGGRLFVTASGLGPGDHSLIVNWSCTGIEEEENGEPAISPVLSVSNPSGRSIIISGSGFMSSPCAISVYDLSGRELIRKQVSSDANGSFTAVIDWTTGERTYPPNGVYFITAQSADVRISVPVVHLQ